MLKILYILICLGLIGILLYFMPIQIKLKIIKRNEDDAIITRMRTLYGLLNLKFELPMLDIVFVNGKPALKYRAEVESNKTNKLFKRISKIFTVKDYYKIKKLFHHDAILLNTLKKYWFKHIKIRELSIMLKLGIYDATLTALTCGTVWAVVGTSLSIIKANLDLTTKAIEISPVFDKEGFELETSCIINFRLGNIINTVIIVFKRSKEIKKKSLSQEAPLNVNL